MLLVLHILFYFKHMAHRERLRELLEGRVRGLQNQRMAWLSRRNRRGTAFRGNNPLAALFRPIVNAANPRPPIRGVREAERVLPERQEIEEAPQILNSSSSSSSSESEDEVSVIRIGEVLNILSFKVPPFFNRHCFTCQIKTDLVYTMTQGFSSHIPRVYCRICLDRMLKRKSKPIKAAADSSGTYRIDLDEVDHDSSITYPQYQIGDKIRPAENFYSIDGI